MNMCTNNLSKVMIYINFKINCIHKNCNEDDNIKSCHFTRV